MIYVIYNPKAKTYFRGANNGNRASWVYYLSDATFYNSLEKAARSYFLNAPDLWRLDPKQKLTWNMWILKVEISEMVGVVDEKDFSTDPRILTKEKLSY